MVRKAPVVGGVVVVAGRARPCHSLLVVELRRRRAARAVAHKTPAGAAGPAQSWTVTPIERAVPAMILTAASMSLAFRSSILICAISRTWAWVSTPTLVLCGTALPFSRFAALRIRRAAGGVLVTKVNERSS